MTASAGSLVVSLGLSAAEYVRGLTKAEQEAKNFSTRFNKSMRDTSAGVNFLVGAIKGVAGALSVGLVVSGLKGLVDDAINAAAALDDMSEKTGASVEQLSALQEVARISGQDFTAVGTALTKLAKTMVQSQNASSEAGLALKALGLSAVDSTGALKGTGDFTLEIAKRFAQFADGTGKTAAAMALYGKAGAEVLPFLKDLAETGTLVATTTTAQAAAAEEYQKSLKRLSAIKQELIRQVGFGLVDAFNTFIKVLERAGGEVEALNGKISDLTSTGAFRSWAQSIAIDVAEASDSIAQLTESITIAGGFIKGFGVAAKGSIELQSGQFLKGLDNIGAGYDAITEAGRAALGQMKNTRAEQTLAFQLRARFAQENSEGFPRGGSATKPKKPDLPFNTAALKASADDPTRKILEGQLKEFERTIKAEKDLLNDRESFLQSYYQDDKIGIKEYFATRQGIIEDALTEEVKALDAQIQLLENFAAKANLRDRADAENKIAEAIDKRTQAQRDASTKGVKLWLDETKALEGFRDKVEGLAIKLSELNDSPIAIAARFDFDNKGLNEFIALQRKSTDEDVRRQADAAARFQAGIRDSVIQRDKLNRATDAYSLTLDKLGLAQDRISIAESSGAITGLEALRQRSAATESYIVVLQKQLTALEAIAVATGKPQDLMNVERMKVQLEGLAAQGDLVAKKFNDVFKENFSDAFASVIDGTKSVKDAFNDMQRNILQSINKMAADEIASKLFGKGGAGGSGFLSGLGDFFSNLFGGSYASGGMPPVGKLSIVGERGPELFVPKVAGTIVPNGSFGGNVISINVNVPQGTSRASSNQIARETGEAVARAMRRDG